MLEISLNTVGRRFNVNWIFRKIDTQLRSGNHLVITGHNGSGKSTLLKVISGVLSPTEGKVSYRLNEQELKVDQVYKHLSICAPYLTLPEELNLNELLQFHQKLSPLKFDMNDQDFAELLEIDYQAAKPIHLFSSGMKQRVKLGLAILAQSELVLLDEPLSNLDQNGQHWYQKMIEKHQDNRLIVVSSNALEAEHFFCTESLNIMDYKSPS